MKNKILALALSLLLSGCVATKSQIVQDSIKKSPDKEYAESVAALLEERGATDKNIAEYFTIENMFKNKQITDAEYQERMAMLDTKIAASALERDKKREFKERLGAAMYHMGESTRQAFS